VALWPSLYVVGEITCVSTIPLNNSTFAYLQPPYSAYKREQYVGFLCIYGALVLPTAALTAYNMSNYTALLALYVVFNIIGFVAGAWQNVFVPYLMQKAAPMASLMQPHTPSSSSTTTPIPLADALEDDHLKQVQQVREREGVKISVAGNNALNLGMTVFYAITIGISYASASASLYAGLYMTTAAGALCIVLAIAAWRFLPAPRERQKRQEETWLTIPVETCECKPLHIIHEMLMMLISQESLSRYCEIPRGVQGHDCVDRVQRLDLRFRRCD
jgi:hypothetical protein